MRARTTALLGGLILATMAAAGCSSGHKSGSSDGTGSTTSPTAPVPVRPPRDGDLDRVLGDWTERNDTRDAVVGVQVGNGPPVFVIAGNARRRSRITETTPLRIHGLPSAFASAAGATPRKLLAFSDTYFRAHVRGQRDLTASYFKIGPNGTGTGVQGVSSDGICALAPKGCPPGTRFFAVAATGSFPGGTAVIVYDPAHDLSVVAVARARPPDVGNLGLRADLLTTLGADGYDRAVGFAAHPVPTTVAH